MSTDARTSVALLRAAWEQWTTEPDFPMIEKHCINGTRVAIEALRRIGVKAKPVSVEFTVFNRFAHDLYLAGVPISEWPDHAWSIGIGRTSDREAPNPGMWDGHLCVEGDGWTLDLSAGAMDRPGKIEMRPWHIWTNLPPAGSGRQLILEQDRGQVLYITRWPENNGWRRADGWNRPHTAEVREILQRMNALIDEVRP